MTFWVVSFLWLWWGAVLCIEGCLSASLSLPMRQPLAPLSQLWQSKGFQKLLDDEIPPLPRAENHWCRGIFLLQCFSTIKLALWGATEGQKTSLPIMQATGSGEVLATHVPWADDPSLEGERSPWQRSFPLLPQAPGFPMHNPSQPLSGSDSAEAVGKINSGFKTWKQLFGNRQWREQRRIMTLAS